MRQMKLLGLVAMALLALSGVIASTALAADELPNVLPTTKGATFPISASSKCKSGFQFGNGLIHLTAAACTGSQTQSNSMSGTFETKFTGVKDTTGRNCLGGVPSPKKGEVIVTGTFDTQGYLDAAKVKRTASVTRPAKLTITCGILTIKIEDGVGGSCTAGELTPISKSVNTLSVTFALNAAKTDNEPVVVLKLGATLATETENCENKSTTDGGKAELSNQQGTIEVEKFLSGAKPIEVEVMPLP